MPGANPLKIKECVDAGQQQFCRADNFVLTNLSESGLISGKRQPFTEQRRYLFMRMVSAVIKHYRLDEVRKALLDVGVQGMTIVDVKGFGRQKGHMEVYRGVEYEVQFLPKVKVEVAVPEEKVEEVIEAITNGARTGEIGDGKIFVYDLMDVVRIRTGRRGKEAL